MIERSDVSDKRFYTYVLYSSQDKGFYIGYTDNLKRRLTQHAKGEVYSTKRRLPIRLIHYEYFINQSDAKAREIFLKSGHGRKQLRGQGSHDALQISSTSVKQIISILEYHSTQKKTGKLPYSLKPEQVSN